MSETETVEPTMYEALSRAMSAAENMWKDGYVAAIDDVLHKFFADNGVDVYEDGTMETLRLAAESAFNTRHQ